MRTGDTLPDVTRKTTVTSSPARAAPRIHLGERAHGAAFPRGEKSCEPGEVHPSHFSRVDEQSFIAACAQTVR